MIEIWKDIEGYIGLYQLSNLGRVKSLSRFNSRTERILKTNSVSKSGYIIICLSKDNIKFGIALHRLVAEAFIPNPEGKMQVNHIDGNKLNNTVDNLEWNTASENTIHAINNKLRKQNCEDNHQSKLSKQQVLEIRESNLSQRKLGKIYNVAQSTIYRIKNRKTWASI